MRIVLITALCLATGGTAEARWRTRHGQGSAPIIAGQPSVRVTPSGNVVAPRDPLPRRDINGKARAPKHRLGPG